MSWKARKYKISRDDVPKLLNLAQRTSSLRAKKTY